MQIKTVVLTASIFAVPGFDTAPVKAGVIDKLIFSNCESAMRSEYEHAQLELIEDELNIACSCVVKQIKNNYSINQAKATCIMTKDLVADTSNTEKEM